MVIPMGILGAMYYQIRADVRVLLCTKGFHLIGKIERDDTKALQTLKMCTRAHFF